VTEVILSKNAQTVLEKRYLLRDENNKVIETPEEMFNRVASSIASSEEERIEFLELMTSLRFLPNSPTLMNAGTALGQLSACFVLPIEDDMSSIFDAVKHSALIHQCLTKDSLVMTGDGLVKIKNVKANSLVETDEGVFSVSKVYYNGKKPVYKVETAHGYSITGTKLHKLLVMNKDGKRCWKKVGSLKKGDWLIIKPSNWLGSKIQLPKFEYVPKTGGNQTSFKPILYDLPDKLTPELSELIGLYIADGSNHQDGIRFTVGKHEAEVVDRINNLSMILFGKMPSSVEFESVFEVGILSVQIKEWLNFLGLLKKKSSRAEIPKLILESSEENVRAFLKGLFNADGCIRKSGHITYTSSSHKLICDLQITLLHLGIPTRKYRNKTTGVYQISICTKSGYINYKNKIGFISKKKKYRLEDIKSEDIFKRGQIIPNQNQRIRDWYSTIPKGKKIKFLKEYGGLVNRSEIRELSYQKLKMLTKLEMKPDFFDELLLSEDILYTQVRAIKSVGIMEVFDLTVPEKHAYIANGFISHNSGGGTGFSFSKLRPKNDVVKTTGGIASGPLSFMEVFNAATNTVKQGGRRRGANMGILRVDHPDIMEFITCKEDQNRLTNFNLSVAITEHFMKAVEKNEDYDLINPRINKVSGKMNAKEVFNKIVEMAWKNGEPGIVFIDRINKDNPTPELGEIESTNPCGELPMLAWESCNLGSINLLQHVKKGKIDWDLLEKSVRTAVRFLDNVIEKNQYILPEIEQITKANRKIGLGIMGFADLLVKLEIRYDSEEGLAKANEVMAFVQKNARDESQVLGEKKGNFPNFNKSIYRDQTENLRNATVTSIAPTGTISLIAGCSSGIEPYYAIAFTRNVLDGKKLFDVNPLFEQNLKDLKIHSEELLEKVSSSNTIQDLEEVPKDLRKIFVTSHDITPEWHIRMQAAFQRYNDNATSKTINFTSTATKEDIANAYMLAYKQGCKGITVYRDGSRKYQVLSTKKPEKQDSKKLTIISEKVEPRPRPEVTVGRTHKIRSGCGNLYVTVNSDETGVCEVFVQVGKSGGCIASQSEAVGRLISLALRSGIKLESIADHLAGIRCPSPNFYQGQTVLSCPDGIAHVLEKYLEGETIVRSNGVIACPDCGSMLEFAEGCFTCRSCGYSKCD